jgi:hypothetical protein
VLYDVRRIREHPLVSKNISIYGYIYDVYSGNLVEVAEATKAGQPRQSDPDYYFGLAQSPGTNLSRLGLDEVLLQRTVGPYVGVRPRYPPVFPRIINDPQIWSGRAWQADFDELAVIGRRDPKPGAATEMMRTDASFLGHFFQAFRKQ